MLCTARGLVNLSSFSGEQEVPAKATFERPKERLGHPAEARRLDVTVLDVVRNTIREDVVNFDLADAESVALKKLPPFASRIRVCNRAGGLRFGVSRNQFGELPELPFAFGEENPSNFVRAAVVDHDFDGRARAGVLVKLFEDGVGMGRVMNSSEGVDEIVRLDGKETGKLLSVSRAEANSVFQSENRGALPSELHGFFGKVHGGDLRAGTSKVDGVCTDAAANFQDFLALPAVEFGESGDVILDEVLTSLYLVEIFPRANRSRGVADVTGAVVPVVLDAGNLNVFEVC